MVESIAFTYAPKNKPVVIKTMMRASEIDHNSAEEGNEGLLRGVEGKPFPAVEGFRNAPRLMKIRTPKIDEVKSAASSIARSCASSTKAASSRKFSLPGARL